ncbi:hypothetical protein SAMN06269185_2283 [Natronoarchaeum philippinense]|uniref:C2H2-type domain-containing protein n=1 Tax=Natronoarchaeum philippinense TaxID=558529 RepID=A0A285NZE3_NATPI|nr:hypothetical protein [Natronoarchaeum philippinense]SNZ14862.1 hypothetical protein SAMN06269185_2283 [Natronoarchaeum philippinense]
MPECDYCEASFADEPGYLDHLEAEHRDELGAIDRRRIGDGDDEEGRDLALYAAGILVVAGVSGLLTYVVVSGALGGDSSGGGELGQQGAAPNPPGFDLGPAGDDQVYQPYEIGSAHYHGPIEVTVGNTSIDFSQPAFQHPRASPAFHFEARETRWHGHAKGVTVEYALETTAFGVTPETFYYDGTLYDDTVDGTTVRYEVNGEEIDPETYVLEADDKINVVAQNESAA